MITNDTAIMLMFCPLIALGLFIILKMLSYFKW